MKRLMLTAGLIAGLAAAPCYAEEHEHEDMMKKPATEVALVGKDRQYLGKASLYDTPAGMMMDVEIQGVAPGWHGFHVHENGNCDADSGFKSAGGHAAEEGEEHGFMAHEHNHYGDMPNVWVGKDGTGKAQVFLYHMKKDQLNDEDGSALILHEGVDDYESGPSGNAGDRIACGVLFSPMEKE